MAPSSPIHYQKPRPILVETFVVSIECIVGTIANLDYLPWGSLDSPTLKGEVHAESYKAFTNGKSSDS